MFSRLILTIEDEVIEFTACELIIAAHQIVSEQLNTLSENEVALPSYSEINKELDSEFNRFTQKLIEEISEAYGIHPDHIKKFLEVSKVHPWAIPNFKNMLDHIKSKEKYRRTDLQLDEHIIIPMKLINMNNIKQWLFIAKYLSNNYLDHGHLEGWWFNIAGRVIRLRNDVDDGVLREKNKQFYVADHGLISNININIKKAINRCIKSFTWHDKGTFYRAFKFWQFFILSRQKEKKIAFIEQISDGIINNLEQCKQFFLTLGLNFIPPSPLPEPNHLAEKTIRQRKSIFQTTLSQVILSCGRAVTITTDANNWIERKFITELPEWIESYGSDSGTICDELLRTCWDAYFSQGSIPYRKLDKTVIKKREETFEKVVNFFLERHQKCIREEFIANLTDEIATSPEQCQLLLLSLAHPDPAFRGKKVSESEWYELDTFYFGNRERVDNFENEQVLTEEQRSRYGMIFEELIEQFRYVTQAIVTQRAKSIRNGLGPFHTQIKQIMHEETATDYILIQELYELAKAINSGKHEPLFRELGSYGDREAGSSYQKFELAIKAYFTQENAVSEAELARTMRRILAGEVLENDSLAFFPCLTAAWFISESARNPLTTMTSLMLLDLIESNVVLDTGYGTNWYSWSNALIHPGKSAKCGRVSDLYNKKINIDEFGGCHPMVHKGSVSQTKDVPDATTCLPIARQKEGHLIIHWLEYRVSSLNVVIKEKFQLEKVEAHELTKGEKVEIINLDELTEIKAKKEKKCDKLQKTIQVRKSKNPDADVSKQETQIESLSAEISKLEAEIQLLEQKNSIKQKIKDQVIVPLLKLRIASLKNLLTPSAVITLYCPTHHQELENLLTELDSKGKIVWREVRGSEPEYEEGNSLVLLNREDSLEEQARAVVKYFEDHPDPDVNVLTWKTFLGVKKLTKAKFDRKPSVRVVGHHDLAEEDEIPEHIKQESLLLAKQQGKIGPRAITGWTLLDVEDKGNCFYDAVVHQMHLINHDFLLSVPEGTLTRDSLRLRIQGAEFEDGEWADAAEIGTLARELNLVIAIVDTRSPTAEFVYHYIDIEGASNSTRDSSALPVGRQILRLAFTGNHYLSVVETSNEAARRMIMNSISNSAISFFGRLHEEFIIEYRHASPQLQQAYDERFGLVLRR